MSTPTPGSDPNDPQGGAPQGQPDWGAPQPQGYQPQGYQPAPSYTGGPAGYGAPGGQRPGTVTGAAIVGIVWGGIGALFALLVMLAAFGLGAGFAGLIFLVSLALSVALLVGGIQVLQGKSPKLLLYVSYAAIALGLISLIVSLATTGGNAFNGVLGIVIPGVIVALLLNPQSKQYFAARGLSY
ncbi:hypothetical protein [Geodermatophilus sp. URMC 64]